MSYDDLRNLLPYQQILGAGGSYIPSPTDFIRETKKQW